MCSQSESVLVDKYLPVRQVQPLQGHVNCNDEPGLGLLLQSIIANTYRVEL